MQNRYLFLLLSFFVVGSVFSVQLAKQPSLVGQGPDNRYNNANRAASISRQQSTNSPNTKTLPMTKNSFRGTAQSPVMPVDQKPTIGGAGVAAKKPSRWARFKKFFSFKKK